MKCICGFEGEGIRIFTGREKDNEDLGEFEQHGIYAKSKILPFDGDLVAVFACQKCGTLKVDYGYSPYESD